MILIDHYESLAPPGCRQYHTNVSGSLESLNYGSGPGSPYLANTNYAVCFKQRPGFCGLQLTSAPAEFIVNSNNGAMVVNNGSECHNYLVDSNNDYIQVLGSYTLLGSNKVEDAYYCGGTNTSSISPIYGLYDLIITLIDYNVLADHGPLVLLVKTDEGVKYASGQLVEAATDLNDTLVQQSVINQRERGFRLNYKLTSC